MKVVLHQTHGGPEVLQVAEAPVPEPGPDEVLVRVAACGLNHLDVLQRRGPGLIPGFKLPHVSGMDIAGTVAAVGPAGNGRAGKAATLAEGTRVVVNPAVPCNRCENCAAGKDGGCPSAGVIGATLVAATPSTFSSRRPMCTTCRTRSIWSTRPSCRRSG